MTRGSAARARPRHRALSRWCHLEGAGEVVTVAQLLSRHHQLFGERPLWSRPAQYRPRYAPPPRRTTVIPPAPYPRGPAPALLTRAPRCGFWGWDLLSSPRCVHRTGPLSSHLHGGFGPCVRNQEAPSRCPLGGGASWANQRGQPKGRPA